MDFSTWMNGLISIAIILLIIVVGLPLSLGLGLLGLTHLAVIGEAIELLDDDTWDFAEARFPANPSKAVKVMKGFQLLFFVPMILVFFGGLMSGD